MGIDFIEYTPLVNPVVRFVRVIDALVWDNVAQEGSFTTAWADSAISYPKNAVAGGIPINIPNLPAGDWDALFYDSASPADTDPLDFAKRIEWTGKQLLNLPIEL
jgi:hypothetical protein